MIDTELLLSRTPKDAIVMMVNSENGTHFPSGTFEFGLPEVVEGRRTKIRLKVRRSHHKSDLVPYEGEFDFYYNRLEMSDHFQDVLTGYRPQLPISTQVVLDELTRRLGQDFFLDDVVLEEIGRNNAAPYRLKAKVESLRWFGELEIWLADFQDLNVFFDSALLSNGPTRMGPLDPSPQLRSTQHYAPFVNGTAAKDLIDALVEGNYAQDQPALLPLLQQTVRATGEALDPTDSPWVISTTPGPYNAFNARMVGVPEPATGINASNPTLNRVVLIELDLNYCTNFNDRQVWIPYREDDFSTSQFNREPRLSRYGVHSLTDGSAFARHLNQIATGSTLVTLAGTGGPFLIEGPEPYVTDRFIPGPRNLYGSVVLYNGQVRTSDAQPANPTLNRVLVLALSSMNTAYRGNFSIHYRAPIVLPAALPEAKLGKPYSFTLTATEGVGPYRYYVYDGAFAPGQQVGEFSGVVSGVATDTGAFDVGIEVIDSRGVAVRYEYSYAVTVAPLLVTGNAPDGQVGVPYNFAYQITGGVAPYTTLYADGGNPAGLFLDPDTAAFTGSPGVAAEGPHNWMIAVRDQQGTVIYRRDSIMIGGAP